MADVVTFSPQATGPNLIIEISTGGDNQLNVPEIFGEWKQWLLDDPVARLGLPQAFTVIGGDPKRPGLNLGQAYFMHPDWKLRPAELDHRLVLVGDIQVLGGVGSFVVPTVGAFTALVEIETSALLSGLTNPVLSVTETRQAVWNAITSAHNLPGSFGEQMISIEATVDLLRKALTNRLEAAPGNPGVLVLYDNDGITPLLTWSTTDHTGNAVSPTPGAPSRRQAAT